MEGVGKIRVNPLGFEWLMRIEIIGQNGSTIDVVLVCPQPSVGRHGGMRNTNPCITVGFFGSFLEFLLSLRFLLYQYRVVYHLHMTHGDTSITVYGLSWLVTLTMVKAMRRFGALNFRFLKLILAMVFTIILICLFAFLGLTVGDLFASHLAFIHAGWAILQIWIPTNPRGAERLPPNIITSESDFYLRRLWGQPTEKEFFEYLSNIPPDSQTIDVKNQIFDVVMGDQRRKRFV